MWMWFGLATAATTTTIEAKTCRGTGHELWRCGDELSGVVVHTSAPTAPELEERGPLGPGVLVALEGDRLPPKGQRGPRFGVRWSEGWIWADGAEKDLKPLFEDWLARGGPGGGSATMAGQAWALPIGCWNDDDGVVCTDGTTARVVPTEPGFATVPCELKTGGRQDCPVTSETGQPNLHVLVPTHAMTTVGCAVVEGRATACDELVDFDPVAVIAAIPDPATRTCRLDPQNGEWRCLGSTLVRSAEQRYLDLVTEEGRLRSLAGAGLGLRVGDEVWVCGGATPVCEAVLEDVKSSPVGGGPVDIVGITYTLPDGCQKLDEPGADVVLCDDLSRGFRFDTSRQEPPDDARKCRWLGEKAWCWDQGPGVVATWKKADGTLLCTASPCPFEGLLEDEGR